MIRLSVGNYNQRAEHQRSLNIEPNRARVGYKGSHRVSVVYRRLMLRWASVWAIIDIFPLEAT